MKQIEYDLGQRVRLTDRASMSEGLEGMVVSKLSVKMVRHLGVYKPMQTYVVRLDNGTVHDVVPTVLELAPPKGRGDLDRVVSWLTLPSYVTDAMKGAASGTI